LPEFGVSWQTVHVPFNKPLIGSVPPPLRPPTLSIANVRVLNSASPRAIERRSADDSSSHSWKIVNTSGFKPPDEAAQAPGITGSRFSGSLMPMQKGCRDNAFGPPCAPSAWRLPASRSRTCAVNNPSSNFTISFACVNESGAPWA